jgi:hypothetical protein
LTSSFESDTLEGVILTPEPLNMDLNINIQLQWELEIASIKYLEHFEIPSSDFPCDCVVKPQDPLLLTGSDHGLKFLLKINTRFSASPGRQLPYTFQHIIRYNNCD